MTTITGRAREIVAEAGCDMKQAVSRAYKELDPDGTACLVNAAACWAAILSVEHPEMAFVGVVKPPKGSSRPPITVKPDPETMDSARRAAAAHEPEQQRP